MVKHIVLWNIKPECKADADAHIAKIKSLLEALVGVVPGLTKMEVSKNIRDGYDFGLYSELISREALEGYIVHPEHKKAGEYVRSVVCDRASLDFEV